MAESVTVYENPHFGGRSKTLGVGQYRFFTPADFNDVISSIKVSPGLCAMLYENADDGGGYGRSVDLLEDCADLSQYNFNDVTSYISVFNTTTTLEVRDHRQGHDTVSSETFVWARNSLQNGAFVPGHWERPRATPPPPNPVAVVSLPKERQRLKVNGAMGVEGYPGIWALGDCAMIPDERGGYQPPTAQHASREGKVLTHNIVANSRGKDLIPFRFNTLGLLASIGRRTGVARILGVNFSGFVAWWLWRTIYLLKLPRLEKKVRVALDWTLDVFFSKELRAVSP